MAPPIEEAEPQLTVILDAVVGDDLQTVTGTIRVRGAEDVVLVDVLSQLPMPEDDLWLRRTFPRAVETGRVRIFPLPEPGSWRFVTVLPRRTDASGLVPGHGLFANGLWHPQPMLGGAVPLASWEVRIEAPDRAVTVVNDAVGDGVVTWDGVAERVALAVVPGGRAQTWDLPAGQVTIVDHGKRRRPRDRRVVAALADAWPGPDAPRMVVIESPNRRRLVRPGPGVLFLSDRAFRVSGPLWRYHLAAVRRGLLAAELPIADPWLRGFVAQTVAELDEDAATPRDLLGWFSWVPQVDTLLYDGNLPFYGEVFDELWHSDPVHDDLLEIVAPQTPPRVVAHRLDHHFGAGTAPLIAMPLLSGVPLDAALSAAGVPRADFDTWRAPTPPQELTVDVLRDDDAWRIQVVRDAPVTAPPEPVIIDVDGELHTWLAGPGADTTTLVEPERPRRVVVDPHGDVLQHPAHDRWPRKWTATVSFFPAELAATQGRFSAYADIVLRRQYDTRWVYDLGLATDPEDLVRAELGAIHYRGPLSNRRSRPIRLWAYADVALLDPAFRPTTGAGLAVGATLGAAWETRVDRDMPMRGHRLSASLNGGLIPGSSEKWGAVRASAVGLAPLSGRVAWAGRVSTGLATGAVDHRLLGLGGSSAVRGVSFDAVVGDRLAAGSTELRWQALRGQSVPLLLAWGSDLQLSVGVDAGTMGQARAVLPQEDDRIADLDAVHAVGWAFGIGSTVDLLGARPTYGGITIAGAPLTWPEPLQQGAWPEIYLQLDGAF